MTWRGRWCCGAAPSTRARASPPAICWPPCAAVGVASGSPGRRLRRRPCCAAAAAGRSSHPPTKPATLTFNSLLHKPRNRPDRLPHRAPDQGFWKAGGSRNGFVQQAVKRQPPPGRDRDTTRINRDEHQDERVLDERTVLVVDEAGMLGSRKLARLLDYAAEARCKIVLVGDDKQLAAIEAGGGFRG